MLVTHLPSLLTLALLLTFPRSSPLPCYSPLPRYSPFVSLLTLASCSPLPHVASLVAGKELQLAWPFVNVNSFFLGCLVGTVVCGGVVGSVES